MDEKVLLLESSIRRDLVLDKALVLQKVYPALLERFIAFLRTLAG